MLDTAQVDPESPAVQTHLKIVQGVIQRMGDNSRHCKVWCVTLVSAVLVLVARTGNPDHALIAVLPTILFWCLDAYYLLLEWRFRNSYNDFVVRLHDGTLATNVVYKLMPCGSVLKGTLYSAKSPSVWPFYVVIVATIVVAWKLIF